MAIGPAAAADWVIAALPRSRTPVNAQALILEAAAALGWVWSDEEAQEEAERFEKAFIKRLVAHHNDHLDFGRPTRFDFNSVSEELIQGSSYIEPSDPIELQESKTRRAQADIYLAFVRNLSGRQFEGACRGILVCLGCAQPTVTPKGNDQGIDFHGLISLHGRLDRRYLQSSIDRAMRTWIIGQAKQVVGNVGTAEIRDFVGALEIYKVGVSADDGKALAALKMKPFEAAMRLFVTTGGFSRDSWKLVRQLGLVGLDGDGVSVLLADHEVANATAGKSNRAAFDQWVLDQLPAGG